jgi:hypothetical protein
MQTPITSPTISTTPNALSAAISLASFSQGTYLAAQVAGAGPGDVFALWAATQSGLTSTTQMAPVPGFQGAVDPSTGAITGWAGPLPIEGGTPIRTNFVYIQRIAGTTPGLTAVFNGQETPGTQAGNPNAILNGGNAFAGPITIGPTDANSFQIGGLGASTSTTVTSGTGTTTITAGNNQNVAVVYAGAGTGLVLIGSSTALFNLGPNSVQVRTTGAGNITLAGDTTAIVSVNSGAGGTVGVATAAATTTLNVGTGAAAITATFGSTNSTSSTRINSGSGGIGIGLAAPGGSGVSIDTPAAGTILVAPTTATTLALGGTASAVATGSFNVAAAGTLTLGGGNVANTVNLATGTGGKTVHIADGAGANTVTLGSTNSTSTTNIQCGSGGIGIGTAALGSSTVVIDTPIAGTIGIGLTNSNLILVGNTTGAMRVRVNTGTGGFGVNVNPDASAMVDFNGTTTQGVRFMNLTTVQKNGIVAPALGLVVYDATLNKLCVWTGAWQTITSA